MIVESPLIKVRVATADDAAALASVFRDSWRYAYAGMIPHSHLDRMIRDRDTAWWRAAIRRESFPEKRPPRAGECFRGFR